MVRETMEGILFKRSASRTTRQDLVTIWTLQLCLERISRQLLVRHFLASKLGYGSEELAIDIVSPFNFAASLLSLEMRFFFGLQSKNLGM
jgi:hypothetical protein